MKFIMLVCPADDFAPTPALGAETDAWVTRYDDEGVRIIGDVLSPESEGAVVGTGGAASTDAIAGFDVLECRDLDHAREVVEAHPMSRHGSVVIRPFMVP